MPNTCFNCISEFDAALYRRSLLTRFYTVPPNRFYGSIIWAGDSHFQVPVLHNNRIGQTTEIAATKYRARISSSVRFQQLQFSRQLKTDFLRPEFHIDRY